MHSREDGNLPGAEAAQGHDQEGECFLDGGVESGDIHGEGYGDLRWGPIEDRERVSSAHGEVAGGQQGDVRCAFVRQAGGRHLRGRQGSDAPRLPGDKDSGGRMGKVVFTNGCFDLFHRGHLETLRYARKCAGKDGRVIVGVNSDDSVKKLKGLDRPILSLDDRMEILNSIDVVDEVYAFSDEDPSKLIKLIEPDIIVKGGDYEGQKVIGSDMAEVKFAPRIESSSTSEIIERIRNFR